MGVVIEFRSSAVPRPRGEAPGTPAEVVIFPGVLIERRDFSLAERLRVPLTRRAAMSQAAEPDHGEA